MVSAPDTNWMSRHDRPASASASRAAARPYSTNCRPHLPHGCIPAPSRAILLSSGISSLPIVGERLPLPHEVVAVPFGVQRVHNQLDLVPHLEVVDGHACG